MPEATFGFYFDKSKAPAVVPQMDLSGLSEDESVREFLLTSPIVEQAVNEAGGVQYAYNRPSHIHICGIALPAHAENTGMPSGPFAVHILLSEMLHIWLSPTWQRWCIKREAGTLFVSVGRLCVRLIKLGR